jgi:hypothetical protein
MSPPSHQAWEEASRGKDLSNPTAYHPKRPYQLGQVIEHKKFGIGIVMGIKQKTKIIVIFETQTKVLAAAQSKTPDDHQSA